MSINVANYLDISNFVINELFGGVYLAYFGILALIIYFMMKNNAGKETVFGMIGLYTLLFAGVAIYMQEIVFMIILVITGIAFILIVNYLK